MSITDGFYYQKPSNLDFRYPSAWNYVDNAKYDPSDEHPDPPFKQKNNTLLWRGGTSEGLSVAGTWKGMARQRLVHLANNLTSATLIPVSASKGGSIGQYIYRHISARKIRKLLNLDIGIVESIARCGGDDCSAQDREFEFKGRLDFQDHWRYKYLFDLDGAGFSGRFLPFLQSRSLPFKTALFREWYDSRITAWLHFVPQDLRLHSVHSTLAYFAGLQNPSDPDRAYVEPHEEEAEFIAEQGREWANKVLRKEDMEIYLFRLLLEWGRLTDDRRDELGYQAEQ